MRKLSALCSVNDTLRHRVPLERWDLVRSLLVHFRQKVPPFQAPNLVL
jgi:hypothetical protein